MIRRRRPPARPRQGSRLHPRIEDLHAQARRRRLGRASGGRHGCRGGAVRCGPEVARLQLVVNARRRWRSAVGCGRLVTLPARLSLDGLVAKRWRPRAARRWAQESCVRGVGRRRWCSGSSDCHKNELHSKPRARLYIIQGAAGPRRAKVIKPI